MQSIPQGIHTKNIDVLLNLHLYLYHRLPSADKMEELKRITLKAIKQRNQSENINNTKTKENNDKDGEEVSFVMKFVHCYGKGQSFGGATLLKEGRKAKTRLARTVTVTDSHFIVVSAENFRYLEKFEKRLVEEKILFL